MCWLSISQSLISCPLSYSHLKFTAHGTNSKPSHFPMPYSYIVFSSDILNAYFRLVLSHSLSPWYSHLMFPSHIPISYSQLSHSLAFLSHIPISYCLSYSHLTHSLSYSHILSPIFIWLSLSYSHILSHILSSCWNKDSVCLSVCLSHISTSHSLSSLS